MENLLNLIFPPKCLFCSSTGAIFCEVCLGKCVVLNQIETLKNQGFNFELKLLSIFSYEGLVRLCIKKSKYQAKQFAALKVLASRGVTYLKMLFGRMPHLLRGKTYCWLMIFAHQVQLFLNVLRH